MIHRELQWRPFFTLVRKEIRRFTHVLGQTVLTPIINSSLYLLIFGVSLGKSLPDYFGHPYLAFLIPGLMMMAALNNSYQNVASSIVGSKFHGDLQDLKYVPLSVNQIAWAMSVGALVRGLSVAFVTLLVAYAFYFFSQHEWLAISNPFILILFLVIGSLCFAQLGLYIGFRAQNFEQLNAVGSFVLLPLLYLGGVFFSVSNLHPFWQTVSHFNPMFYFINGVRYGLLGHSDVDWVTSLIVSMLALAALHLVALFSIKRGSFQRW